MKRYFLLSSFLYMSLSAQEATSYLRGEVNGSNPTDRLFIEVYEQNRHMMIDRVPLSGDGRFEGGGVQNGGHYEVRVVRQNGEKVQSEDVVLSSSGFAVEIQLPRAAAAICSRGPVSLYRLQHQVPGKAKNEFKRAEMAWSAGKSEEAIGRLEKALELDPGYMEAHNNLGTKLLAAGQRERAAQEFRKSIELDPTSPNGHVNLAICLLVDTKDRETAHEAELHARKALQLDPSATSARYALGIALAWLNKDEALPYLRDTADVYPRARLAAANLLERLGRSREAREWRAQMQASEVSRSR